MTQFSKMFLENYMPHILRDYLRDQFSRFEQGSMTVVEFLDNFHELARHATFILDTEYERVH